MDNIELFDNYIKGKLSEEERIKFDNKIKSDAKFSSEFKSYLFIVNGICKEAEQNDIEFGTSMKKLSKEQLKEIIGPRKKVTKPKVISVKSWLWQATSIAAIFVIAFTSVLQIEKRAQYDVDNVVYTFNSDFTLPRSSGEQININEMSDDELKEQLPKLKEVFNSAIDEQEIADKGYQLAIVHIRLHDRDNARDILNQLISKFEKNENYKLFVEKCKSILALIE